MKKGLILLCLLARIRLPAQLPHDRQRDSLRTVLEREQPDSGKVLTLLAFAGSYSNNDERAGFPAIDSAFSLATRLHWTPGIARAEALRGMYVGDSGNNAGSRVHFQRALAIDRRLGYQKLAVRDLALLTRTYNRLSDYPNALRCGLEAVDIAENLHDDSLLSYAISGVTITYLNHKNYPKGTEWALRGKAVAEKVHARGDLVDQLTCLAYIRFNEKNKPAAKALLREALRIAETLDEPATVGSVLSSLGEAEKDTLATGIAHLYEAGKIFAAISPGGMRHANALNLLGSALGDSAGNATGARRKVLYDSAIAMERAAAGIFEAIQNRKMQATVYDNLAQLETETGNFRVAYQYDLKSDVIYDSLYSQKLKDELAAMQDTHDREIGEKEIAIEKLAVADQRKLLFGVAGGILLVGIAGIQLFRENRLRKKSNRTLLLLNDELAEANRIKARFFGILSHDLRSPVANLLSFLRLVRNQPGLLSMEEQALYQQQIGRSAEELLETMEAMLLWSKEQMDAFKPDLRKIPVSGLFDYLQKFFGQERNAQIRFSNPDDLVLSGDENYLRVIMQNLTGNALKALENNPAGCIEWKAVSNGGRTILSITDNGPGLDKEQAKALYSDASGMNARSGFGFHLIRDLARAIHYQISFDSTPGTGTTFVLQP